MNTPVPQSLLLATDLDARSDRALDRAAQLAAQWSATLVALHVLEPQRNPDQALAWLRGEPDDDVLDTATRALARDLAGLDVRASLRIARADDPAEAIRDAAEATGSALVLTGMARNEALGRVLLGSTVERLARHLPVPLLVVRQRVHGAYQRITVATDLSEASREALRCAVALWPTAAFTLYHVCTVPQPMLDAAADSALVAQARRDLEAFLDGTALPPGVPVQCAVGQGSVERALTGHVRRHAVDLVVLGAQGGGSALRRVLLGSTAQRLLDWLPCDSLLVRPRA